MLCLDTLTSLYTRSSVYLCKNTAKFSGLVCEDSKSLFPSGIIAVYKPKSWTSNDVVRKLKVTILNGLRLETSCNVGRNCVKIGHGGTLDPLAEGVLVIGINRGTKYLHQYLTGTKEYLVTAKFGIATDTYDCTGKIINIKDCNHISQMDINRSLEDFTGEIDQVPPMYSALKLNGKRLYEYAREGSVVERSPRRVLVERIQYMPNRLLLPEFELKIICGGGFYVRSLIHDLGIKLNTYAHMTSLVRSKQGAFDLSMCLKEEDWNIDNIRKSILPVICK